MKLRFAISYADDFSETIDNFVEFESVGVDRLTVPEVSSFDAVSQLGYIAAKTSRIELAFGTIQQH
ncbi:LLM class flavin-dependent oxidoreductase [Mycobacterium sp. BMJ-28]